MNVPGLRVFQSLLRQEQALIASGATLQRMIDNGATGVEFSKMVATYGLQSLRMYRQEMDMYNQLVGYIQNSGSAFDILNLGLSYTRQNLISLIPVPQPMPAIMPRGSISTGRSGLAGPELIIGGIVLQPWVWALLAVVAIAVVIGALYFAEAYFEASKQAEEETAQFKVRSETYERAWQQCLASGHSPETCARNIHPPETNQGDKAIVSLLKTGAIIAGVLVVGGFLIYTFRDKIGIGPIRKLATSRTTSNPQPASMGGYFLAVDDRDDEDED